MLPPFSDLAEVFFARVDLFFHYFIFYNVLNNLLFFFFLQQKREKVDISHPVLPSKMQMMFCLETGILLLTSRSFQ